MQLAMIDLGLMGARIAANVGKDSQTAGAETTPPRELQAASDEALLAHVFSALFQRFTSRREVCFANQLLSAMQHEFSGHAETSPRDLE